VWQLQATTRELVQAFGLFLRKAPQANFDDEELRKMQTRLAPATVRSPAPSEPFIAKSLDDPLAVAKMSSKTDARTIALPPGINPYGKTE
jgi:hypothetical protein